MSTHDFKNDSDQAERRRVERDTFLSRTQLDADRVDGRFAKQRPTTIIAKNPASAYPRLPPSSPWSAPCPSGDEPPLNVDVNAVPDLGFHEASPTPNSGEAPTVFSPLSVETSPSFLKRRI
jgi:hypothetical protein